jgi:hypothetical protein
MEQDSKTTEPIVAPIETDNKKTEEPQPKLIEVVPLRSFWLTYWLWQHRIPENVARNYCREVHYKTGEKEFAAIGFHNDAGGWLIRNRYHRSSIGPAGPTHLAHGSQQLAVFTDFVDLLTLVGRLGAILYPLPDLLLLAPTDGVSQLRDIENIYSKVHLWLPNDGPGNRLTEAALRYSPTCHGHRPTCLDHRLLYKGYKNLNDWACHVGKRRV